MARPWRMARTLDVLLDEINDYAPRRNKRSDGGIGDAAHATRASDHNPWVDGPNGFGIVTARDFTHDPAGGFDAHQFAEWLRTRCKTGAERRVKYVISNRRIASSVQNWAWREYSGANPHTQHVHVSVQSDAARYDSTAGWSWWPKPAAKPPAAVAKAPTIESKVELTAAAADFLTKSTGTKRKAGEMLSLRYIVSNLRGKL